MVHLKQNGHFLKFMRLWGVDRAIAYILIGRGWSVLSGPITLLVVARFLSPAEQGFYYTFWNVLGLQIFFELGLAYVILQYASHEKAKLEWTTSGVLEGDSIAKGRLASLFRTSLIWYGIAAALVIAMVLPAGMIFFISNQPPAANITWRLPWIWFVFTSAGVLLVSPVFALLEGCGAVAEVAMMRVGQSIGGSLLLWLALWEGAGLFATAILSSFGVCWALGWLWFRKRRFLFDLFMTSSETGRISWRREVWPFQWKIALSWLSGYFIFQLFGPLLFIFQGAVAAGQMGMSMSIMASISTVGMAWVQSKAPTFGTLVARRDFQELDRIFFSCLWQSFLVVSSVGAAFWLAAVYLYSAQHPLSLRILHPLPLGLLTVTTVLNHIWFAEAVYLRAHKQDPYMLISVVVGCLIAVSSYFLGARFAATGMMAGYCAISMVLGAGVGTWIFRQKRRLWHSEDQA